MDLETLRAAKQGLREGLISEQDYDVVKQAFLRAQQLKAGFDVGFIRQEDYQKARDAYLNALDFSVMATRPSGGGPPPLAAAVATPTPARVVAAAAASPRHAVPTAAGASPRGAYAAAVASSPRIAPGAGAAVGAAAGAFVRSPRSSSSSSGAPVVRPRVPASPSAAAPRPAVNGAPSGAVAAAINGFGGRAAGTVRTAAAAPANGAAADHYQHQHHHHPQGAAAGPSAASPVARLRPAAAPAAAAAPPPSIPKDVPQYSRGATAGKFSMAGIGLTEECVNLFLHMKTRSAYKWITFKVDDSGRLVVPDRVGAKDGRYEHFIAALPPHECRYGVFDYEYTSPERGSFNKIVFINWAPESAHIKTKMMYAATKDFFKGFLDGTGAELQANEAGDLSEEEMRLRVVTNLTRK